MRLSYDMDAHELSTNFLRLMVQSLSVCKQNTLFTDTYLTAESPHLTPQWFQYKQQFYFSNTAKN